ncbi:unnamed protein product [Nezara viridula]|uniref:Uncharacterized protein n=1 Tax=Nezara viridula TaxID=85310 RepID=A0A9P0EAW3_NEZVI|nr:unnamed protein product [Nezara viridula]
MPRAAPIEHTKPSVDSPASRVIPRISRELDKLSWPVITSLWEPLYTPSSAVDTPPPVWGSDVWGPPITPPPNPPHTEEVVIEFGF